MRVKAGGALAPGARRTRWTRWPRRAAAAAAALAFVAAAAGCTGPRWQSELASVNAAGTGSGNGVSWAPQLSPDGTKVVFQSNASDLGPTDTNGTTDVYVRDLGTGDTRLVSVNAEGTGAGDGQSTSPYFSPDGSKILFASKSTNLTSTPTSGHHSDLYVRDLATGTTRLVSVAADGTGGGDGNTTFGQFSPTGNKILFTSDAHNLAGSSSALMGVFERDMAAGVTTRLSDGSLGVYSPSGDAIAFLNNHEAWLRDTSAGTVTSLSAGLPGSTDVGLPTFSPDGTKVTFERRTNVSFVRTDIFVYDRTARTARLVTVGRGGTGSSDNTPSRVHGFHPTDSNRLLFSSAASNLVANDTNTTEDVFVRNLATGVTTLASANATGRPAGWSNSARWVGNGNRVAFVSEANNLGPADSNVATDVYVRDVTAGTTSLVSANAAGNDSGNGDSGRYTNRQIRFYTYELSVSSDGSRIAFGSDASNFGPADGSRTDPHDVYVARLA
jgi:Tol biopolymer transport system component